MGERDTRPRWLGWTRPQRVALAEGRHGPLEVCWEMGYKVLNSANGNQSFGTLHHVWQRVLKHIQLQNDPPEQILLLGLGGGSVVHILRTELGIPAHITAIEIDPVMVDLAKEHFDLSEHANVEIIIGDAVLLTQIHKRRYDLVLVDLFDDLDLAQGADTRGFAHALRELCTENGAVCFNTVSYDTVSEQRCTRIHGNLYHVFGTVMEFRTEEVNRVFIAR